MIIKVPESKKIYYQNSHLNEDNTLSFENIFDDNEDIFNEGDYDLMDEIRQKDIEEESIPVVERILYELDVLNYELKR